MPQCIPLSDPDAVWPFCPSTVPAAIFALLFGVLTITHLIQAIRYRKTYCWVMVVASLWQTLAYAVREYSVFNQKNSNIYSIWFILTLTGPLWINAFVYMVVARMVWCFLPNHKLGGINAWRFGTIFVLLDILAFLVQLGGAAMASGTGKTHSQVMLGLHIYMGGVGLQQFFIICFTGLIIRFHLRYRREAGNVYSNLPMLLLYVLYAALGLITVRIIYRLIEYSAGDKSGIPTHEVYNFVLEALPMFIAVLLFNIIHPGRVMPGPESDIPGKKQRRRMAEEGLLSGRKGFAKLDNSSTGLAHSDIALMPQSSSGAPDYPMAQGYEAYRHA